MDLITTEEIEQLKRPDGTIIDNVRNILKVETMADENGRFEVIDGSLYDKGKEIPNPNNAAFDGKFRWQKKTQSGFKEIKQPDNSWKRMEKEKKHDKPWLWITLDKTEMNLGGTIQVSFKITVDENKNSPTINYTGNQDLPIIHDGDNKMLLNISFTNGEATKNITLGKSGIYTIKANSIQKAQFLNDTTFKVFNV